NVPRGNTLSPTNRTINYWRMFSSIFTEPPSPPSTLTSNSRTKSSISLNWKDNSNNEHGFKIFRSSSNDGAYSEIGSVTSNITSFTDNLLSVNSTYFYKICAYNNVGISDFSPILQATTLDLQIPAVPSSLTIDSKTKTSVTLRWIDNSSNEKGFRIYRSNSSTEGFSEIATVTANNNSYIDNSLLPGTTYYYRIRAYNDDGLSSYTTVVSATTIALQIPLQPGNLIASHIDYTSSTLVWEDNSNNETGFELERCITDNCENSKTSIKLPANTKSYADMNLSMNTSYQYRIRAINDDGNSGWSNMIVAVTPRILAPVAPTKLKSTKFTDKSISVTWKDNSSNEDAFIITRSLAVNPSLTTAITLSANDTAFTDSSLVSSTTYFYTIKAINKGGQSSLSNKNVATTLSQAELKRVKNGLITYYNFGFNPDYIIYDQSGYGDPLNLHILNRSVINWNKDNTIDIMNNTAVVSLEPATKIIDAVKQTNEFTFECWLKPTEPFIGADSRIASISSDNDELGFALDQWYSRSESEQDFEYSVRLQTASTVTSGYPEYNSDLSQSYINLQHLVYTRDHFGKETLYLNGNKSSEGFRPSNLDTWKSNYYLRLGNESDMNHSWTGSFYSVAIYNRALSEAEVAINKSAGPCDSIQVADISYNLELYPNPAPDEVKLLITPEVVSDIVPRTTIRILDVYGRALYEESVFNPNRQIMRTINTRNFAPGIYLVQIVSGEKQKTARLIKP
ncbi:MAG: fibronectin type III domain-containing protein, partial [Bacteroidales bacterium]|nr:fibronectin type III domain-containing protein [Bacteroidales bacterium]